MHQEPSRFLSDAKRAMNLIGAYPVLRGSDHPDSAEPLVEADRRIFHKRAHLNREHLLARLALPRSAG